MADVAIVASAIGAAPRDYTIPGAQEILPKAVSANLDGSSTVASWYPCLQVLSPAGQVMFSARGSTAVAAGGSATASWFPGVGGTSTDVIGGQIVQTYWGNATVADFTWTGPPATEVSSGYPTNNTFTKLLDNTYLQIMFEGDFIPGTAADNIGMGCFLNGGNRLNVFCGTVGGGAISSVNGSANRGIPGDPVSFPAGAYTVDVRVNSHTGQTTKFLCSNSATISILEIGPV